MNMDFIAGVIGICLFVVLVGTVIAGTGTSTKPLSISVSPRIAFAPAQLTILIRLQPDVSDRYLQVQIDGGEFFRSSAWTIEGQESRTLYRVEWREVPAGEYEVIAAVGSGSAGARATDRMTVQIQSRFGR